MTRKNQKHLLMVKLLYSAGLRVSELVNLKLKDLEIDNNYGWVRQGKGNKDRLFIIAKSIKGELVEYLKTQNLSEDSWLFPGRNPQNPLNNNNIRQALKAVVREKGLTKPVTPVSAHTLFQ